MTKQEKIKEAYGEYWEKVKDYVNENGWCSIRRGVGFNEIVKILSWETRIGNQYCWRPKSLQGIENNNGWTKIESEEDLPKEKGLKCLFLCIHGNTTYISDDVLEDPKWFSNKYSHWRLKNEIKDPIY